MDEGIYIPTELVEEILLQLPANSRRRFRLVCRSWRDIVEQRTVTDLQSRAKTLLVFKGSACVLDDHWGLKKVWASDNSSIAVVGTSNGVLCLCDDSRPGGAVVLANPKISERLAIPRLTRPGADIHARSSIAKWHRAYGFAYHQATGQYKVVLVPCSFGSIWEFRRLQVFTLGEEAPVWRDVSTPSGVGCDFNAGVVTVNGATYWMVKGTQDVMSFDHEHERVTRVKPLPVVVPVTTARSRSSARDHIYLAEVRGRLGVAVRRWSVSSEKTDVWVLEDARGEQRWSIWYSLKVDKWQKDGSWSWYDHKFTLPHLAHGEHVLTRQTSGLFRHEPIGTTRSRHGALHIGNGNEGTRVSEVRGTVSQVFAHVETKEPLGVYRRW